MKSSFSKIAMRCCWASLFAGSAVLGADTNTPPAAAGPAKTEPAKAAAVLKPEEFFEGGTKSYNNWVEFSGGGFIFNGNKPQFQQQQKTKRQGFGGLEDLHYTTQVDKTTTFTVDGRAIADNNDYKLRLDVTRQKVGYLRLNFNEFRTWYNGDGGFDPASGDYFPLKGDAKGIDRGEFSIEAGLTLEKKPQVKFKYTHGFRDGEKSSTIWGITHPGGVTRGLSPTFYDINESRDAFQLDVTHHVLKSDVGVGLRYEFGNLDNSLKITQAPGEPAQQKITDKQNTGYDLFNANAFTETWFKEKLLLSTGFSFSDLDNDFSGSRIYGSDFDVSYAPNALAGAGYFNLNGGSHAQEYVANVNLLALPTKNWTIVPSVRIQREDTDAQFTGSQTLGANAAVPFSGHSDTGLTDVRERLDARYTRFTNWVFFGRCEWTEGQGNVSEFGGTGPVGGIGGPPIQRKTEDERLFQKYSLGGRWYPLRTVSVDAGGYGKINHYDYTHNLDSTSNDPSSPNRYPAFLVMQDFETLDGNFTLTLRPCTTVSLVSRYEYQVSTIDTKPAPISGLAEIQTSDMTSHIFAQNISWTPWSRLFLQAGFNYVASEVETPTAKFTQAILDSQNNYWTLNFNSGLVINDKTDFNVNYFYYRANDYQNNSAFGVPYGSGTQEHGVTATLVRRLSERLRLTVRYGFFHSDDDLYGGHRNFDAHGIFSTIQYRF
jgi:hypothetical protein